MATPFRYTPTDRTSVDIPVPEILLCRKIVCQDVLDEFPDMNECARIQVQDEIRFLDKLHAFLIEESV